MKMQHNKFNHILINFIISLIITTTALAQYSGGSGTEANPFQIATANDLITLGQNTADYDKHFILTANIDLANHEFTQAVIAPGPSGNTYHIGEDEFTFTGHFDGNNHSIINMTINRACCINN
ncbi:MAG: hypothetical protein JEZ07_17020 [Phycisphaerae bacterium]|nr:hypothetical protein [Phycisphaerae bacterium]